LEFLKSVRQREPDAFIIIGVEDDATRPVFNHLERTLMVLSLVYCDAILIGTAQYQDNFWTESNWPPGLCPLGVYKYSDKKYHAPFEIKLNVPQSDDIRKRIENRRVDYEARQLKKYSITPK